MKITKKLLAQVAEYQKRWVENGGKLTSWRCGHCKRMNKTPQPKKGDVSSKGYWDSATMCLKCGMHSFVAVWPNGKTSSKKMPC
jgi:hypothetical protein